MEYIDIDKNMFKDMIEKYKDRINDYVIEMICEKYKDMYNKSEIKEEYRE